MGRRYYWLKLKADFFRSKHVKRLRALAGGDTYTVIYLKMLLLAIENDGVIFFDGVCGLTPEDELALDLDECVDNIKVTVNFLKSVGLLEEADEAYLLPESVENTGSESSSAERMRRHRGRLVYNKTSHCDVEKEKEIEIEIETELDKEREREAKKKRRRFTPPTAEEIRAYCEEKGFRIDTERFIDYYSSNGWKVGKNSMKSWKAAVNNWHRRDMETARRRGEKEDCSFLDLLAQEELDG